MKERPILFNDEMVRALLEGRKTQTRRLMKPQPEPTPADHPGPAGHWWPCNTVQSMVHVEEELQDNDGPWAGLAGSVCPCGQPGDRLWVREAWGALFADPPGTPGGRKPQPGDDIRYRADPGQDWQWRDGSLPWRPSIHMPRWACRILLEVTAVRVERLQDISEEDAKAEGAAFHDGMGVGHSGWRHDQKEAHEDARSSFARLWRSINGPDSWAANPWVWVVEFRRLDQQQADTAGEESDGS